MEGILHDIQFALRQLRKAPAFTAIVVVTLALGIGATTTVFCWIQAVLWRPFPGVRAPDELVVLCNRQGTLQSDCVSYPNLKDYAKLTNIFAGVIGSQVTPACLSVEGNVEWVYGQIATADFFDVLGVQPGLGRFFRADEEQAPGSAPVLVLSHGFWQRRFGGDPSIVNRPVELNRKPFTIIGVAPAAFRGTMSGLVCDFWAPLVMHQEVAHFGSLTERGDSWLHTIGRLQPRVTQTQAQAAVDLRARQLEAAYPASNRERGLVVLPPYKSPWGGQAFFLPVLQVLMVVSFGVLLIVAANIANLLLARAIGRQKEISIRLALGIKRRRLVAQLLTESLLLALVAGAVGILMAHWTSQLLLAFMPNSYLPIRYQFQLDGQTLVFTLTVSLITGVLFGIVPAFQALRTNLQNVLKEGGRTSASGGQHHRIRNALVVAEVALALTLLAGAALCIQGFRKARQIDPGFDPSNALVAGLRLGAHGYTEETAKVFYRQLRERLAALPGVRQAALASWFPLGFEGGSGTGAQPEGYQRAPNEDTSAPYSIVSPHYFDAMRIPLLEGRDFTERDDTNAAPVVVINEALAQRYWPGQSALGRRLTLFGQRAATVIGVVKTGKYRTLSEPPRPFVFLPAEQGVWDLNLGVILRTTGSPTSMAGALRREVRALDPGVEVWATLPYEDFMQAAFIAQRIAASLLALLAFVSLFLASLGIYGVMAYLVGQRTHEIGVRMALGARIPDILRLIMARGIGLTSAGMLVGLLGSLALTRLLGSFLHGVSPFDPLTFLAVTLLLAGVATLACLLPALRGARVDPVVALRGE